MWIPRTPEESIKWQKAGEREAGSHGRLIAGITWVLVSISFAGGSFFFLSGGIGVVLEKPISGGFWLRLPACVLVAAPFAYWLFRYEKRKELAKIKRRTICTHCETTGDDNLGAACQCGGSFVSSSTVKWVENS